MQSSNQLGKLTFSNTSVFTSAKSASATGAIQQKREGLWKKRSALPQGSYCPSVQQGYWCYQSAVSLSSLWPLCGGACIFWGPTFYSQSPLFMLYGLINFKLLPNRSSLPSLERSPFCAPEEHRIFTGYLCVPNDLGSIFICAAHMCRDPGSLSPRLVMSPATVISWGKNRLLLFILSPDLSVLWAKIIKRSYIHSICCYHPGPLLV